MADKKKTKAKTKAKTTPKKTTTKAKAKAKTKKSEGAKVQTKKGTKVRVDKPDMTSDYDVVKRSGKALKNLTSNMAVDARLDTSNPFKIITDLGQIRDTMNEATNAAYDQQMREAQQAYNRAEDSNYTNTNNTIAEMRRNLVGSASSGANVGAANATALQAMLGLGQQNAAGTTEALQGVQNISGQKAAALAQNAADALDKANSSRQMQGQLATDQYSALTNAQGQRAASAAEAVGNLATALDTNRTNTRMNNATNMTNLGVATIPQKQQTKNVNKNINKNK